MPLRALRNNEDFFSDDLTEKDRKQYFECPNCTSKLIPIIPKQNIIKHFRHKEGTSHYEPETEEHFTGKNELKLIANSLGFKAITEYRIGNHITDVFVNSPNPIAIEYQCAKCSSEEIKSRSQNYIQNKVNPLWILGTKFMEHPSKVTEETITLFQEHLLFHSVGFPFYRRKVHSKYELFDFAEYDISYEIKKVAKDSPVVNKFGD